MKVGHDANDRELQLRDYKANGITGVEIGTEGHKLWVCVDGQCVLRIVSPKIELTDHRKDKREDEI